MAVLVTGAAGYIGSHAVDRLLREGHHVVAVDNLCRGHQAAIDLLSAGAPGRLTFVKSDISDRAGLEAVMKAHRVDAILHFAALAAVGESVEQPLLYYRNNVAGMIALLDAAVAAGVERVVFSSSAATYGIPPEHLVPIPEDCPKSPINPYGWTKLHGEHILHDVAEGQRRAGKPFSFAALRYFNVAGCDRAGRLGEDHDPETHIIPVVLQAALGKRSHVGIFGTDYPTPDGTCVRDYVHVEDLVDAHVAVLRALKPGDEHAFNLGIGRGYSVREIINAVKAVTGKPIDVREQPRRAGDPPQLYAQSSKIRDALGWRAQFTDLHQIIESAWKWFSEHPRGYKS
ncbi:MAG: UDP-glucose 4-epimerase GalE [Planctomycetota bacterium]|nr:UDP-glucose 4-epimerase GalE [Planctomycetota bacterium]